MDTDKAKKIFLIHIVFPLFLGVLIYALWRKIIFVDPAHKIFPLLNSTQPPDWVTNNLPDGLWMYAFLSTFYLIWRHQISKCFIAWILLAIILSFILEILQSRHIIPGTFDFFDLLAYALSSFIFGLTKILPNKKLITLKF